MSKAFKVVGLAKKPLASRNFLPELNQLKKEQLEVISHLPSEDILVSGPAGSGKTILAAYRYESYGDKKGKVLVFGNVLKNYLAEKIGTSKIKLVPRGIFEYAKSVGGVTINMSLPDSKKFEDASVRASEWAKKYKGKLDFIIIDEAQDFFDGHLDFCSYLAKSLTLFADDAQRLYSHGKCTISILGKYLTEHSRIVKRLDIKGNYRNQPPVSQLANPFYNKRFQEEFPAAELEGELVKAKIFVGDNVNAFSKLLVEETKKYINIIDKETPKIGILVQDMMNMRLASDLFIKSKYSCIEVDNAVNIFNLNNPVILTMQAAKGLEFDYVILFNIEYKRLQENTLITLIKSCSLRLHVRVSHFLFLLIVLKQK